MARRNRASMIKSINIWAFPGGLANEIDPVEAMRQAKDAGFDGIELCIAEKGVFTHKTKQSVCEKWRQAAKDIGIQIVSVATGQLWAWPLTHPRASVRKKAYEFVAATIERAGWLGAGAVLVVPGCVHADFIPNCPEVPYDVVWKTSLQQLKRLAKVAEKHRVFLCVENVWNKFLYSPLEMKQFVDAIGSRWAGVYFDVGNPVAFGIPHHWIPILGRRIKRVHIKEYKRGRRDDGTVYWLPFPEGFDVPFGEGDVNWKACLTALKKVGYKGPLTAEVLNFDNKAGLVEELSKQVDRVLALA